MPSVQPRRSARISANAQKQTSSVTSSKKTPPKVEKVPKIVSRKRIAKATKSKKRAKTTPRQSPIDIIHAACCFDQDTCKADSVNINYHVGDCCDVIVNEGGFRVNVRRNCATSLTANHLPSTFELAQFHAHWGSNGSQGSEHLLNGKALSGEVHFVFWNTTYASFQEAVTKDDGLAVVGVFLKEGKYNDNYHGLIDTVRKATGNNKPLAMPKEFVLDHLLPPADQRDFVTYLGSLTTPPYSECVIWTVFTTPVEVSFGQLNVLRNIIPANHRECQDLCGRTIRSTANLQ